MNCPTCESSSVVKAGNSSTGKLFVVVKKKGDKKSTQVNQNKSESRTAWVLAAGGPWVKAALGHLQLRLKTRRATIA